MNNIVNKNFRFEDIEYTFFGIENEHIFKQIPWYEKGLLEYINNLNLNGVYVDVGGNIGNHSLYFLNHCKSTKLYVFEPEELCYNILNKNLTTNGKKEFIINNSAVWDKECRLKIIKYDSYNNMGMSKVVETDEDKSDIIANSLDNVISFNDNVVLIKIDAEGSEPKVLHGAEKLIKLNMPVIICEAATESEFNEINKILIPWGYKIPTQRFNATPTYVWHKI
jgi:FkbM family methyltransferase